MNTQQMDQHPIRTPAVNVTLTPNPDFVLGKLYYGGAYDIVISSNQNPRWTPKPLDSPMFTHYILVLIITR